VVDVRGLEPLTSSLRIRRVTMTRIDISGHKCPSLMWISLRNRGMTLANSGHEKTALARCAQAGFWQIRGYPLSDFATYPGTGVPETPASALKRNLLLTSEFTSIAPKWRGSRAPLHHNGAMGARAIPWYSFWVTPRSAQLR
jgi:hypothetical protein